ncbi:MAG: hypothetical protein ABIO06_03415 [Pseudolysinimonas sp.]
MRLLALRITLGVIAAFQLAFGVLFLVAPQLYPALVGLHPAPAWTSWIFGLFGARAIGYAVGMVLTMRDPLRHRGWIATMIGVQAIDGIVTLALVAMGVLTFAQVSTAGFMPIAFIVALALTFPRARAVPSAPGAVA